MCEKINYSACAFMQKIKVKKPSQVREKIQEVLSSDSEKEIQINCFTFLTR